MKKYPFLAIILLSIFFSLNAEAANKKVLLVETMDVPVISTISNLIRTKLFTKGPITIDIVSCEGKRDLCHQRVSAAIERKDYNLVISLATMASQVVQQELKGKNIPQFFTIVTAPVSAGIVEKIGSNASNNITGLVYGINIISKLKIVEQLVSQVSSERPIKIGRIYTDYPSSVGERKLLEQAIRKVPELSFEWAEIPYQPIPEKLNEVLPEVRFHIESMKKDVIGFWAPTGPLGEHLEYDKVFNDELKVNQIVGITEASVRNGALLAVIVNWEALANESVEVIYNILNGKPANTFPVRYPQVFDVWLNLKTAERMGIVVPSTVLSLSKGKIVR